MAKTLYLDMGDMGDSALQTLPVKVRQHAQARRLVMRIDRTLAQVRVTVPKHTRDREIHRFLQDHKSWIAAELEKLPPGAALRHGDNLMFLGQQHTVRFLDAPPRKIRRYMPKTSIPEESVSDVSVSGAALNDWFIDVGGPADQAPARLLRWLKKEASRRLSDRAKAHADTLDTGFNRLSIGDMRTRWGSCSGKGTLRFNWRLVLAPPNVLDYVAAHEVGHLLEMNHSPAFWAQVKRCKPDYEIHRRWLKTKGQALMAVRIVP